MLSESQWISDTSPGDQSQGHATAVHNVMTAVLTGGRPRFLQASASWNPQTSAAEDSEQLCRAICLVATRIAEISWYIVFVVCCLVSCCVLLFLVPGSWFKKKKIYRSTDVFPFPLCFFSVFCFRVCVSVSFPLKVTLWHVGKMTPIYV